MRYEPWLPFQGLLQFIETGPADANSDGVAHHEADLVGHEAVADDVDAVCPIIVIDLD